MNICDPMGRSESEVMASVRRARKLAATKDYTKKKELAAALATIPGHPLHTLTRENQVLAAWISHAIAALDQGVDVSSWLFKIRELAVHYAKKGDLLYPLLKVRYEVAGPSDLMWT